MIGVVLGLWEQRRARPSLEVREGFLEERLSELNLVQKSVTGRGASLAEGTEQLRSRVVVVRGDEKEDCSVKGDEKEDCSVNRML